jgi:uncharacterized protein (TIGR03083 family)
MTPRTPLLQRPTAMRLAATEYERCATMLSSLNAEQWTMQTECPKWDVRQMAAHMLGMVDMAASIRESRRQQKAAVLDDEFDIDALTALQVDEHADWSGPQIAERFAARVGKAARGRKMAPGFLRRRSLGAGQPVGAEREDWSLGFLLDVILTRDPWMHRSDITQVTGAAMVLSASHDGALVADVVAEWAARHGQPYRLRLTGPAGGEWSAGSGGEQIDLDAMEFCRLISGRGDQSLRTGLLATDVPF